MTAATSHRPASRVELGGLDVPGEPVWPGVQVAPDVPAAQVARSRQPAPGDSMRLGVQIDL